MTSTDLLQAVNVMLYSELVEYMFSKTCLQCPLFPNLNEFNTGGVVGRVKGIHTEALGFG